VAYREFSQHLSRNQCKSPFAAIQAFDKQLSSSSWVFREPVDPVLLGIPTYFEVIPKKDARDLRTIRQKLDSDKYDTTEAFEADVDLMLSNAIKFNGADSEVGLIAVACGDRFRALLNAWKSGATKKRKDGDSGTPQPSKKVKTG
jgi:transcription initiation factor TFIID subunit 2